MQYVQEQHLHIVHVIVYTQEFTWIKAVMEGAVGGQLITGQQLIRIILLLMLKVENMKLRETSIIECKVFILLQKVK